MAWRLVFAFIALSAVSCKDLIEGEDGGKLIWTEEVSASPLIPWTKTEHVYVYTDDEDEFISKIVVVDQYPDKPGKVEILEGGVGQEDVLIEFSRDGVFRGFNFHVEVYSKHDKDVPPHKPHKEGDRKFPKTVVPINETQSSDVPAVPKTLTVGASDAAAATNAPAPSEVPQVSSNVPQVSPNVPVATDLPQVSSDLPPVSSEAPQVSSDLPLASSETPLASSETPLASSDAPQPSNPVDVRSDPGSTTVPPFVNADGQTALVGLVIPVDANATRVRRQVEDYDINNGTELYDEDSSDNPNATEDYNLAENEGL